MTLVLSGIALVGTCLVLYFTYRDPNLLTFSAGMFLVSVTRISVVVAYGRQAVGGLTPVVARRWQSLYEGATSLYCGSMACATWYNFEYHDAPARICCMIGTFTLCAGLSARIGMRVWVAQLSGFMMLASLAIQVLRAHELLAKTEFILICVFFFAYCLALVKGYATMLDQLRTRNELRELSEHDALTGLANRRFFHQRLEAMCQQQMPFALLFIDLDRFKQVNDTHGHAMGDKVLEQVGRRLLGTVRKQDVVARLGGDEFVILEAPVSTVSSAATLARRVNVAIAAPFLIDDKEMRIGASVGIRMSREGEKVCDRLLDRADAALYRVKETGGGGYHIADD